MLPTVRLYAHALALVGWALLAALFHLEGTTVVIALMCVTVAAASVVAERERSRRRRDRQGG